MSITAFLCSDVNSCETDWVSLIAVVVMWAVVGVGLIKHAMARRTAGAVVVSIVGIVVLSLVAFYAFFVALLGGF